MGLTDREAAPLMRACTGKVTTDTTNPVTVEVQDEAWMRAVCAPIMLAGRPPGPLSRGGAGPCDSPRAQAGGRRDRGDSNGVPPLGCLLTRKPVRLSTIPSHDRTV